MQTLKLPKKLEAVTLPPRADDLRLSKEEDWVPEKLICLKDPDTQMDWGYVVIDNTCNGPGLGGIRLAADLSINEVVRLARVMTLKNTAARIPYGGGKSGLIVNPDNLAREPEVRKQLFTLFAEALFEIVEYCGAPDMGTNENDIQLISEVFDQKNTPGKPKRTIAGRPADKGGIPIDDWGLTAHGLFAAAKTLEELDPKFSIAGAKVVVQGYGNVGSWTATKLHEAGAIIVGASDIYEALWNPKGLDVEELNRVRHSVGGVSNYSRPVDRRFPSQNVDWLLEAPCDILVPAARPDAITSRNADRIDCRVILQGANTPSNKMTEYYLQNRRNILSLSDFIVNVGGVIGCAVELKMSEDSVYSGKVKAKGERSYLEDLIFGTVSRNVREIHTRMKAQGDTDLIFRELALLMARDRLKSNEKGYWL